jgi:hypothetical protein
VNILVVHPTGYFPEREKDSEVNQQLVLGSPVSRLEKNRDWTGTEPEMTGKLMDRKRPRPQSGPQSNRFEKIDGPIKNWSLAVKFCRLVKR